MAVPHEDLLRIALQSHDGLCLRTEALLRLMAEGNLKLADAERTLDEWVRAGVVIQRVGRASIAAECPEGNTRQIDRSLSVVWLWEGAPMLSSNGQQAHAQA